VVNSHVIYSWNWWPWLAWRKKLCMISSTVNGIGSTDALAWQQALLWAGGAGRIDVTPFYIGCRRTILSRCFFDPISSTVVRLIIHTSTIYNRHSSSVSIITDTVVGDALLLLLLNRCCSSSSAAAYFGSCPVI